MIRVEVAVAAPVRQTLTYLVDEKKWPGSLPGKRVIVPLGRQAVTGYILDYQPEEDLPYKLREVREVRDQEPLFPPSMVIFFRWIASYYHHPVGEVIKTALPAGLSKKLSRHLKFKSSAREQLLALGREKNEPWCTELEKNGWLGAKSAVKLLKTKRYGSCLVEMLDSGEADWHLVVKGVETVKKLERCLRYCGSLPAELFSATEPDKKQLSRLREQLGDRLDIKLGHGEARTLDYVRRLSEELDNGLVPLKELRKHYSGANKYIDKLVNENLVTEEKSRIFRTPLGVPFSHFEIPQTLSPDQTNAVREVKDFIDTKEFKVVLLHGVTGCGKTEVYLRAAQKCLDIGRDVLVLVPEIALASQLESHFVSRFPGQVVLLHSGLSVGERYDQWSLAAAGTCRVVIGARSGVFAPLADPGLIIVDEEHDSAYKQDSGLRYNGRDLAVLRAKFNNALVILGSATPGIISYHNAAEGKYHLIEMNHRVLDRSLPTVELVDLKNKQQRIAGKLIGKQLSRVLSENLAAGNQSMLLLNRRGFSSMFLCRDCGEVVRCTRCNISLTYHKSKNRLLCHYCGYSLKTEIICAHCSSDQLVPVGFGTERVEQELAELFPDAAVARLDVDIASNRRRFHEILKKMHDRQIDILLGTQMIAKGHDFPSVTLVGVVSADGGINMPDFRAAERTYQLLSQVTGRAGRGEKPGRVVIQTFRPDHYAIDLASSHDYRRLYKTELEIRRDLGFPPYERMVNIRFVGTEEDHVRNTAMKAGELCRSFINRQNSEGGDHYATLLGPTPCPLSRIKDRFRWQMLIHSTAHQSLHYICDWLLEEKKNFLQGDTGLQIDVDPENMM
ncbi:MAG: primosomal protein N' [Thermodesulfobacteriota bacterium]